MSLPVSEIFGPTLQGEGPYAGRVAAFVRLGGCNLSCSWCDTAYTWDSSRFNLREELTEMDIDEILTRVAADCPIVILTGGEPMLYARRSSFEFLIAGLRARGQQIHLETNGTRLPSDQILALVDVWVVSPKLSNAGAHRGRQDPAMQPRWSEIADTHEVHLKYVCESAEDVGAAMANASRAGWPRMDRVWVMPQASGLPELRERWPVIASTAAEMGINATSRLHLLAWGDERGR